MKIAIRRGHQRTGGDIGAEGFAKEIEAVEQYMPYIIESLKSKGYEVLDVTPPEANRSLGDSLSYGINKTKEFGADLFISCHANAYKTTDKPMGGEVIFPPGDSVSRNYALDICTVLKKNGFINRGAKQDTRGLTEMNGKVGCPAVIVEPFFVDSKADVNNFNWIGGIKLGREIGKAINAIPNLYKPTPKSYISVDGGGTTVGNNLAINLIIRDYKDVDRVFGHLEGVCSALWAFDINPPNSNYAKLQKNVNQVAIHKSLAPNKEYKILVSGYRNKKKVTETSIVLKTVGENKHIESNTLYKVQVGAFKNKENAEKLKEDLKKNGYKDTYIKEK